jgi:hypothetical protein
MNVQKLIRGIEAVRDIINNSRGVYGLHMNGNPAPWEDLERGGRFEDWLFDFNEAEDEIEANRLLHLTETERNNNA